jgi:large subunit ribosomal protein L1
MANAKTTKKKTAVTEQTVDTAPEVSAATTETPGQESIATAEANDSSPQPLAKAGKRSAKALKETAEKQAKEERKAVQAEDSAAPKPKPTARPTRTRLERSGKKFREAAAKVEKGKLYTPAAALELATQTSPVKFDATVEVHINLAVDPKLADQNVRDNFVLPAGTGRQVRVAVFSDDKVNGADLTGVDTILKELEKGSIAFDILIATPAHMPKLGKYARVLGPRGLMPNPKSGTVTNDITKAVREAKAGRVEYRVDSTGIVHLGIGKVSFGYDKLQQNFQAVVTSIKSNKPASVKGSYIKAVHVTTSMGPSIAVALSEL